MMPQHRRVGPVSRCTKCRRYCRMVATFLFSHVGLCGLVVGYSIVGAFTFEALEAGYELRKRESMVKERQNVVSDLWNITFSSIILSERNWTMLAKETLLDFEITLVKAVRKEGYDGKDESPLQWTFSGALLYSIIVITTIAKIYYRKTKPFSCDPHFLLAFFVSYLSANILKCETEPYAPNFTPDLVALGYGNIAPKTPWGKIVTIFYAIIGIPLLLLCLSNIGDAMAHSFRFIYWKICCYFCLRPKKRRKKHRSLITYRPPIIQPSARTVDSGPPPLLIQKDSPKNVLQRVSSSSSSYHTAPTTNEVTPSPSTTSATASPVASHYSTTPPPFAPSSPTTQSAAVVEGCSSYSPPPQKRQQFPLKLDPSLDIALVPIISNKYILQGNMDLPIDIHPLVKDSPVRTQAVFSILANKNVNFPYAMQPPPKAENNSFSWKHQRFQAETDMDLMDIKSMESLDSDDSSTKEVDVPMWLCLILVIGYICGGAVLFTFWEKWNFLDSSYFCFVTLTTIGFGDLVPGTAVISDDNQMTLGLCSLYLLFGMALLAMSFNLVQEEVTRSVRCIGQRMGIVSDDEDD